MSEVKKFASRKAEGPIPFEVDDDTFYIIPVVPGKIVLDVVALSDMSGNEQTRAIMAFLDKILLPESADRFAERLGSQENPIEIETAVEVAVWALEEVVNKGRPTPAPSQSANGSDTTGTGSADGALPTAGTPTTSTPPI